LELGGQHRRDRIGDFGCDETAVTDGGSLAGQCV
jgi:hypothetical protein